MTQEPYAADRQLFYPGRALSAAERARIDALDIAIDEVTIDHLIYSMSKQIENNFQTFFSVAQDVVGEAKAREIAFEIGRRYGGQGYAKLLRAEGKESGGPRDMAIYQDLVHAIRGPKHASALFAEHNDSRCVVKRQQCIYYSEENPQNAQYTGAFESGCFEGYKQADPNLLRVEVHRCRWKGDSSCEQHWVYQEDGTQPPETVV